MSLEKIFLLFLVVFLTSCFSVKQDDKQKQNDKQNFLESKDINQQEIIIPVNEKTSELEKEFSKDLNELLNLINDTSLKNK